MSLCIIKTTLGSIYYSAVVLLFFHENKKLGVFFLGCVSLMSSLLFKIMLLFLLGSGISLAYLTLLFFFPVEAPEETSVSWLFSAKSCLWWFFSPSFEDYHSACERLSCAAGSSFTPEGPRALLSISSPLPACQRLDKMGNCPANQCLPMQTI